MLGFLILLGACSSHYNSNSDAVPIIPVRNFFRKPDISYILLSPSGEKIAFTSPFKQRMNLFVTNPGSGDTTQLTFFTDRDIASYFWKSDSCLLVLKDQQGDENYHLYAVNPFPVA